MDGASMLSFVPLNRSALDRCAELLNWINSWAGGLQDGLIVLTPEQWFKRGHDVAGGSKGEDGFWRPEIRTGTYVWAPPPSGWRRRRSRAIASCTNQTSEVHSYFYLSENNDPPLAEATLQSIRLSFCSAGGSPGMGGGHARAFTNRCSLSFS